MTDGADPERPEYQDQHTHCGIMPVILVKLIMACSGSGGLPWRRWC